jgi:hypothetical protein
VRIVAPALLDEAVGKRDIRVTTGKPSAATDITPIVVVCVAWL